LPPVRGSRGHQGSLPRPHDRPQVAHPRVRRGHPDLQALRLRGGHMALLPGCPLL
ncbi:uncharacterized protein METZ01_LOCUS86578, partial [marine metagenome]